MHHVSPRNLVARPADDGGVWLVAPGVGLYVDPPRPGTVLGPGEVAGYLIVAQRAYPLVLPGGAGPGRAADLQPGDIRRPVQCGDRLFRLAPPGAGDDRAVDAREEADDEAAGGLPVEAPLAGTFYRAPGPGAPPFVEVGQEVTGADRLCIIEAMKVMNLVRLGDLPGAPGRARVEAILTENAAPVAQGDVVMRLAPLA
jgi:acetyl-CoA carboxylase biotin carboxyl carrier protein